MTNLLKTQFKSFLAKDSTRKAAFEGFQNSFDMNSMLKSTANELVTSCSESSQHHSREIDLESKKMPDLVWAIARAYGEIFANSANIRTLNSYCDLGKVATIELSELMNYDVLKYIDPEKTKFISVSSRPYEKSLEFTFEVEIVELTELSHYLVYVLYEIMLSCFWGSLFYFYRQRLSKEILKKPRKFNKILSKHVQHSI